MKYKRRKILSIFLIILCVGLTVFFFYKTLEMKKISIGINSKDKLSLPSSYNTINTKVGSATLDTTAKNMTGAINELNSLAGLKWTYAGQFTTSSTCLTLPSTGMYLLLTGHNSTASLNTLWILRSGSSTKVAHNIAYSGSSSTVTITVSNGQFCGQTTAGNPQVWYVRVDQYA